MYLLKKICRPQTIRTVYWTGKSKRKFKSLYRSGEAERRYAGSCPFLWTSWNWKDNACRYHCKEMGVNLKITSGPAIEKPGEMAAILNNLQEGDLLFVDEIHRLNRQVEEVLYPAMEDFSIDIVIGKELLHGQFV